MAVFPNPALRLYAAHNSVLAGPPLALRQAASNSLRVAAQKIELGS